MDPSGIPLSEKVVRCNIPFYSARPDSLAQNRLRSFRFALRAEFVGEWEEKLHRANENPVAPPLLSQVTATSINKRAKHLSRRFREIPVLNINSNHFTLFTKKSFV